MTYSRWVRDCICGGICICVESEEASHAQVLSPMRWYTSSSHTHTRISISPARTLGFDLSQADYPVLPDLQPPPLSPVPSQHPCNSAAFSLTHSLTHSLRNSFFVGEKHACVSSHQCTYGHQQLREHLVAGWFAYACGRGEDKGEGAGDSEGE